MAFDPHREDYQRLAIRYARSLDTSNPMAAARAFSSFGRRFAQDRDSLPQTDADRAFHLVAEATTLIDYQLPFATDEEAETIISRAHRLLEEALGLDPLCHDAARMDAAASCPSFESYYDYLHEREPEVRARCEESRSSALEDDSEERGAVAANLALRPHLRWLAMMASKALICGRNREAISLCDELLVLDPTDMADARFTAALAYAKLEDEQGLDHLEELCQKLPHHQGPQDAWMLLARLSLAYRNRDALRASQLLSRITELYPHAIVTLSRQRELPDGVFSRLALVPFSEDELIIAVSEATVLLQEGRDSLGRGVFGSWLLQQCLDIATHDDLSDLQDLIELLGQRPFAGNNGTRGGTS